VARTLAIFRLVLEEYLELSRLRDTIASRAETSAGPNVRSDRFPVQKISATDLVHDSIFPVERRKRAANSLSLTGAIVSSVATCHRERQLQLERCVRMQLAPQPQKGVFR
jgi:hypothetical protein